MVVDKWYQHKLNTNSEDVIFTFQRCIAINGIQNVAKRADLLDRSVLVELLRIKGEKRKELSEITANLEADRAEILGFESIKMPCFDFCFAKEYNKHEYKLSREVRL